VMLTGPCAHLKGGELDTGMADMGGRG
jgi:hypothetical protein